MKSMFLSLNFSMVVTKTQIYLSQCAKSQNISYWLAFEYKWRSKIGHQGQKGQISKIVANHLKHVENRYLIEKTPLNQILSTFSIAIVKSFGLSNFHECTRNFLSPGLITMKDEKMLQKVVKTCFWSKILILHTFQTICNNSRDLTFLTLMTDFWPLFAWKLKVTCLYMTIVVMVNLPRKEYPYIFTYKLVNPYFVLVYRHDIWSITIGYIH